MWNAQLKIGNFIKLFFKIYLIDCKRPFLSARSHRYIQSTSVLWLANSKTHSFGGTVSPEKTNLVPLIFSNKNGNMANHIPNRKHVHFLL
jgi:hypothetical protein